MNRSVPDAYAEKLISENILTAPQVQDIADQHFNWLNDELIKVDQYQPERYYFQNKWKHIQQATPTINVWDTGVDYDLLQFIGKQSVYIPNGFVSLSY